MQKKFEPLYFFQNENRFLIEIKRLDQAADAPPGKIYQWLYGPALNDRCIALEFVDMKQEAGYELRTFTNSTLRFGEKTAELTFHGSQTEILTRIPVDQIHRNVIDRLDLEAHRRATILIKSTSL